MSTEILNKEADRAASVVDDSPSGGHTSVSLQADLNMFANVVVNTMRETSEVVDKKPLSTVLMVISITTLILGFFLRLRPFGIQISSLEPIEFFAIITFCGLLLACVVGIRLYHYHQEGENFRAISEAQLRLTEKSMETSAQIQEKSIDRAAETQNKTHNDLMELRRSSQQARQDML